jgi:thiamine biosynthesis protein ThiI
MPKYLIRLSGEMSLKGTHRRRLEKLLERNIIASLGGNCSINWIDSGRALVEYSSDAVDILRRVFGVLEVLEVAEFSFSDIQDLSNRIRDLFCEEIRGKIYALRVHRVGTHSFTSIDVAKLAGEKLRECGAGVDLENPEIEIYIEIRGDRVYATTNKRRYRGFGGLPLGSQARVLVLFSGGFDSTVATWLMLRKGSPTDLLHIRMGSLENLYRVIEVAEKLARNWALGHKMRFFVANFSSIIREIKEKIDPVYWQIALRRSMLILAQEYAKINRYASIVTGESIWEANSQTIENIDASSKKLDVMIIRPVIGLSKDDIIDLSIKIGLYEDIKKVKETCWLGSYTPLKINESRFMDQFSKISDEVFKQAIKEIIEIDLYGDWRRDIKEKIGTSEDIEIDTVPDRAVIVNLTKRNIKKRFIGHKVINLSEIDKYRDQELVLVCEEGELSELLAESLRRAGFKTYSLKGGLKRFFGYE